MSEGRRGPVRPTAAARQAAAVNDLRRRVKVNRPAAVGQAYLDGDADALAEAVAEYHKVKAEFEAAEAELLALKKGDGSS